ncbi:MAG: nucleotidyltransferase [Candidatus Omnitrophota bacterium]|nr:MAG: nucleotidyltransferase [Candidatus Omnitrophota bacterium]
MDKEEIIRLMRENSGVLTSEYGVSRIGIFGSSVKGAMTAECDLDIVVEFNRSIGFKFIRLIKFLEELFGKKVDVVTKDGIENIRVKEVARNIKKDIIYVYKRRCGCHPGLYGIY